MAKVVLPFLFFFVRLICLGQTAYITKKDSTIVIGQPFTVNLVVNRAFESQLFCPDTNSNFYPFSFHSLQTHESQLVNDSTIKDSATYTLVSYQPFKSQDLQLSIGLLSTNDSIKIKTNTIPLLLDSYIDSVYNEMRPQSFTPFYEYKKRDYNWALYSLGLCLLIALSIAIYLLTIYIYKQKKIQKLNQIYSKLHTILNSKEELNLFINNWKHLVEKTTAYKFSSMTTAEIKPILKNEEVLNVLTKIDQIKYNPKYELKNINTEPLITYANTCLTNKIKELNGKS